MSKKGALAYWFDIAPEVRELWLDWYLSDHMPSRVGTVFSAGRCYEAIDASSSHMVLFETPEAEDTAKPFAPPAGFYRCWAPARVVSWGWSAFEVPKHVNLIFKRV